MAGRLEGKVALITGAASMPGLGSATAIRFAEEGARLYLTDVDTDGLEKVAAQISAQGVEVITDKHDVSDEAAWDDVFARLREHFGRIDVLVNNAGIALLGMIGDLDSSTWHKTLAVNLDSVFFGTQRAVAEMRQNKSGGSIINLSSIAGLVGVPGCSAYAAAKGGVRLFTKTVAMETAAEQIRVNSVHPGMIETNMQNDALRDTPEQYDIIKATIPMKEMGRPEDIANINLFLASDESGYVTGSEFTVDGGFVSI